MTVKELIKELQKCDEIKKIVICSTSDNTSNNWVIDHIQEGNCSVFIDISEKERT